MITLFQLLSSVKLSTFSGQLQGIRVILGDNDITLDIKNNESIMHTLAITEMKAEEEMGLVIYVEQLEVIKHD